MLCFETLSKNPCTPPPPPAEQTWEKKNLLCFVKTWWLCLLSTCSMWHVTDGWTGQQATEIGRGLSYGISRLDQMTNAHTHTHTHKICLVFHHIDTLFLLYLLFNSPTRSIWSFHVAAFIYIVNQTLRAQCANASVNEINHWSYILMLSSLFCFYGIQNFFSTYPITEEWRRNPTYFIL